MRSYKEQADGSIIYSPYSELYSKNIITVPFGMITVTYLKDSEDEKIAKVTIDNNTDETMRIFAASTETRNLFIGDANKEHSKNIDIIPKGSEYFTISGHNMKFGIYRLTLKIMMDGVKYEYQFKFDNSDTIPEYANINDATLKRSGF